MSSRSLSLPSARFSVNYCEVFSAVEIRTNYVNRLGVAMVSPYALVKGLGIKDKLSQIGPPGLATGTMLLIQSV